jgi:hypothetical protein
MALRHDKIVCDLALAPGAACSRSWIETPDTGGDQKHALATQLLELSTDLERR